MKTDGRMQRLAAVAATLALLASACGGERAPAEGPSMSTSAVTERAPSTTARPTSTEPAVVETTVVPTTAVQVATTQTTSPPVATDTVDGVVKALTTQPLWTGEFIHDDVARCLAVGMVGQVSTDSLVALFIESHGNVEMALQLSLEHGLTSEQRALFGDVVPGCFDDGPFPSIALVIQSYDSD